MKINGNFCSWAILTVGALSVALGIYWQYLDHTYYYRQIAAHVVETGPIYPGDTIFIERTFCANVKFSRVDAYIYDQNGRVYPLMSREFTDEHPPCPTTRSYPLKIPDISSIETIHFQGSHAVYVNPIRTDIVKTPELIIPISRKP